MIEILPPQHENKFTNSSSKLDKTNRVGMFAKTCIFCGKIRKKQSRKMSKS